MKNVSREFEKRGSGGHSLIVTTDDVQKWPTGVGKSTMIAP
jgi:hypothetical protein